MLAWRDAWTEALYGDSGFYRHHRPAAHFRTSPMVSDEFAGALARLARAGGHTTVHDVGCGSGELLRVLHRIDPELELAGIEIRPRPPDLPEAITWLDTLPERLSSLTIANELLDTVPSTVVEVDSRGIPRVVLVDQGNPGAPESLGPPVAEVEPDSAAWLEEWWPLSEPGQRAVVGLPRDELARSLAARLVHGTLVLVDYGHTRESRPFLGGIQCYRAGRQIPIVLDGSADVTASVAVDSVAAGVEAVRLTQADALRRLGLGGHRSGSPGDLARAATDRELTDPDGLGGFHWMVAGTSDRGPLG